MEQFSPLRARNEAGYFYLDAFSRSLAQVRYAVELRIGEAVGL